MRKLVRWMLLKGHNGHGIDRVDDDDKVVVVTAD